MDLKINGNEKVIQDVSTSGTYYVLPEYIDFDQYKPLKKITVGETEYDYPEIIDQRWTGKEYLLGFRCIPEEERAETAEQAIDYLDNMPDLFPDWTAGVTYKAGNRVLYDGKLYKVLQGHTSQGDWKPDAAASLFTPVHGATASDDGEVTVDEWPEFVQPTGSHDAYKKGDKITYAGKHYISLIDANVYSPDAYAAGWQEQA